MQTSSVCFSANRQDGHFVKSQRTRGSKKIRRAQPVSRVQYDRRKKRSSCDYRKIGTLSPFQKKIWIKIGIQVPSQREGLNEPWIFSCLTRFNNLIRRTASLKVLLLVDSCTVHESVDTLIDLSNMTVDFLPPNTTSERKPLDAEMVACNKSKLLQKLLFRSFHKLDIGEISIYNIENFDRNALAHGGMEKLFFYDESKLFFSLLCRGRLEGVRLFCE